jgi:hypothetical protein
LVPCVSSEAVRAFQWLSWKSPPCRNTIIHQSYTSSWISMPAHLGTPYAKLQYVVFSNFQSVVIQIGRAHV